MSLDNLREMLEPALILCGPAALILALYFGLRFFMVTKRIREESRKSFEIASNIEGAYQRFHDEVTESRQRLKEQFDEMERDITERMERSEKIAKSTRDRLIQLETYLKEFFEGEMKSVFESFDRTVTSILEEMKSELLRGVDRIEEIQAVVDSKAFAQDRILDGEGSVYRMISETAATADDEPSSDGISLEDELETPEE